MTWNNRGKYLETPPTKTKHKNIHTSSKGLQFRSETDFLDWWSAAGWKYTYTKILQEHATSYSSTHDDFAMLFCCLLWTVFCHNETWKCFDNPAAELCLTSVPSISTKTECDYLNGWIKNGHIRKNLTQNGEPQSSWGMQKMKKKVLSIFKETKR